MRKENGIASRNMHQKLYARTVQNAKTVARSSDFPPFLFTLLCLKFSWSGTKPWASSHTPTMWNFQFVSSRWEGNNEDTRQQIFEDWVEMIKSTANRWRVPQHVRRTLPPHAHIRLGLDFTKLWYAQGAGREAKELDYCSSVEEIFEKLRRQSNTAYTILKFAQVVTARKRKFLIK